MLSERSRLGHLHHCILYGFENAIYPHGYNGHIDNISQIKSERSEARTVHCVSSYITISQPEHENAQYGSKDA